MGFLDGIFGKGAKESAPEQENNSEQLKQSIEELLERKRALGMDRIKADDSVEEDIDTKIDEKLESLKEASPEGYEEMKKRVEDARGNEEMPAAA